MTAQTSWRRRFASVTATATAVLLAASGALMAPAIANAEEPVAEVTAPVVTVSKAEGLNPAGETITVTGSGFLPNPPATNGAGRPPLMGKFGGAYVVFGKFADVWRPSESAPKDTREAFDTKWAVHESEIQAIGGEKAGAIEVREDGTFETTLNVSVAAESSTIEGNFGVYTYPGGGANYAPFETYTPITFATEAPAVTSVVSAAAPEGLTVDTDLKNIPGSTGAYVAVIEAGTSAQIDQENMGVKADWVVPAKFTDGAAKHSFVVPAGGLDRAKSYEVLVWKGHTMPNDETILGLAPLAVSKANWDKVFPEVVEAKPQVAAKVSAANAAGLNVKVDLKGIAAKDGAYVTVIEAGKIGEVDREEMGIGAQWVLGNKFVDGAASVTLNLPKSELDRKKQYEVISWPTKSFPTASNLFGKSKLTVSKAQWDKVFPVVAPKIPFTDMKPGDKFYKEISWMYTSKLSTGTKQANGTVKYLPKENVSREAMAAFLYRQYSKPGYKAPAKSPFTDVKTTDKFYKEIAWMKDTKISTGTKQANGTFKYLPKDGITREAMAAFMYRIDTNAKPQAPKVSPFVDVKPGDKFYKEIAWMHSSKLSTGNKQPSGKPKYAAKDNVTREAMAAFLFRAQP